MAFRPGASPDELVDGGVDETLEPLGPHDAAVDERRDALHGGEQDETHLLGVPGGQLARGLSLGDQLRHQGERRRGGLHHAIGTRPDLAREHQPHERRVLRGEPDVRPDRGPQAQHEAVPHLGERRAQLRVQAPEPRLGQGVEQGPAVREVTAPATWATSR